MLDAFANGRVEGQINTPKFIVLANLLRWSAFFDCFKRFFFSRFFHSCCRRSTQHWLHRNQCCDVSSFERQTKKNPVFFFFTGSLLASSTEDVNDLVFFSPKTSMGNCHRIMLVEVDFRRIGVTRLEWSEGPLKDSYYLSVSFSPPQVAFVQENNSSIDSK